MSAAEKYIHPHRVVTILVVVMSIVLSNENEKKKMNLQ